METERRDGAIDPEVPSAARMYDFLLGGMHNFEADREAARRVVEAMPDAPMIARVNRSFLRRAVRLLVGRGVRQFLDIGSGVPTVGNVHEVAQGLDPDARVVYVDTDPVAVTHAGQILEGNDRATAVAADLREPAELLTLLEHPRCRAVLDLDRPVGLLLVSMLHFVPGEQAHAAVSALADALAPGSYLVISHPVSEGVDARTAGRVQGVYQRTGTPGALRTRAEVERFFDGFALVPPGLVWTPQWHPDGGGADSGGGADGADGADGGGGDCADPAAADPRRVGMLAGAGRKPGGVTA